MSRAASASRAARPIGGSLVRAGRLPLLAGALIACLLAVGCAPEPGPALSPPTASESAPSPPNPDAGDGRLETPEPTLPSTQPELSAPSEIPTTPACLSEAGQMVQSELLDPALPRSIPYRIYLPPCYDAASGREYPVLYLLHGLELTDSQWDDLGADEAATRLIASGAAPPFLMVMPWERKGLEYESALVDYLLPAMQREYRASQDRSARALAGISRGAGWALRIGLKRPQVFGAVGLHSPAVLAPDLYDLPGWLDRQPAGELPRLWIDIGDHDPLRFAAFELTGLMDVHGVEYAWRLYPGWHAAEYWSAHMPVYLRWHVAEWQPSR